jgi:outer membrane protein TolC
MKKLFFLLLFIINNLLFSQTNLDIQNAISMALENSELFKKANSELSYSKENNILFQKRFLPSIYTSTIIPSISKSVTRVTTPEGIDVFVNQNLAYYDLSLNIEQNEPFFGGQFTVSTFLNRIDLFGDTNNKTYFSTPISLSYRNNDFSFNSYKYEKLINELKIKESNLKYSSQLEDIVFQTVEKYFDAYIINRNIEDKVKALNHLKEVYEIAKERFKIGSINKGDILSLELNILDIELSLDELNNDKKESQKGLLNFIKNKGNTVVFIEPNESILNLDIPYEFAEDKMSENNVLKISLDRVKVEKELEIKKLKSENKLSIGLDASYGLSNTGSTFSQSTSNLLDQQSYTISLKYLLFDFGKNKQQIKLLKTEKEILVDDFRIEMENNKQELYSLVNKYKANQKRLLLIKEKSNISNEMFEFSRNRFSFGKVTINDLNRVQKESRQIDNDYLNTLKESWIIYYSIRKLTMYDFLKNEDIRW